MSIEAYGDNDDSGGFEDADTEERRIIQAENDLPDSNESEDADDTTEDEANDSMEYYPLRSTIERANLFFPGVDLDFELVRDNWEYNMRFTRMFPSPTEWIKNYVKEHVQRIVDKMDQDKKERLMKKANAAAFCKEIGMNPKVVEIKFEATRKFEEELGVEIKFPILDSVYHLIDHLDIDNPFGEVNNHIEERCEYHSYMGVEVNPRNLRETLQLIRQELANNGLQDQFMHGTTATALHSIDNKGLKVQAGTLKHDFGQGFYCFKGQLEAALIYAFSRSWPHMNPNGNTTTHISRIPKDNPAVVVFSKGSIPKNISFHVGFDSISEDELKEVVVSRGLDANFKKYLKKKKTWKSRNDQDQKWKEFVSFSRCLDREVPEGKKIIYGWLHDSDFLDETNECAEPIIEESRWVQYCFREPKFLEKGVAQFYIELHIDWAEWVERYPTRQSSTLNKKETLDHLATLSNENNAGTI